MDDHRPVLSWARVSRDLRDLLDAADADLGELRFEGTVTSEQLQTLMAYLEALERCPRALRIMLEQKMAPQLGRDTAWN